MNQRTSIQKSLKGIPCTHQEFKDAIAEALRKHGGAKPHDIIEELGDEWASSTIVGKTMANMAAQEFLTRDDEGVYRIGKHYDIRKSREFETQIVEVVREMGGFAHTHEILDAFGCLPNHRDYVRTNINAREGSDYRRIHFILRTSKLMKLYYKEGHWGLLWDDAMVQPTPGEWTEFLIVQGFYEYTPAKLHTARHAQLPFTLALERFKEIGAACQTLRVTNDMTLDDLLVNEGIRKALEYMRRAEPRAANGAYNAIRDTAIRDAEVEGRGGDERFIEKLREREVGRILAHLLDSFEQGSPLLHRVSSALLFRAYAACFSVDAAWLSRGYVLGRPPEGGGRSHEATGDTDEFADDPEDGARAA